MAEPEGLLIEGARRASVVARELWWRARPPEARRTVTLAHVKRRLEVFLTALYGDAPALLPADAPPAPTWLARFFGRAPRHLDTRTVLAATDGVSVWLPRAIAAADAAAVAAYRLWAVEQTARARRGSARCVPADPRERDLYLIAEAIAIDAELARTLPGLVPELRAARHRALAERPVPAMLTASERAVEGLICRVLAADAAQPPDGLLLPAGPPASLAWARSMAAAQDRGGRYRGVAPVALWGDLRSRASGAAPDARPESDVPAPPRPPRRAALRRTPRARHDAGDEDDASPGTWMIRADEPMESAEDPAGLQRPADRDDDADAAELADSIAELPETRVVRTPDVPREILESEAAAAARRAGSSGRNTDGPGAAIVYPEWDYRLGAYRTGAVVVRTGDVAAGADRWIEAVMARHAALVRRVRRRFESLRPRRVNLGRQPDGSELDLAAYVAAFADWHAGTPADDRFYLAARPARRDLAIVLLADVSASTDSWVAGSLRIIDVEKESLVVLLEALDALGDRHAALVFAGEGPRAVRVGTLKAFDERTGRAVRRRIAGLEPDGYTRVGAAVRHASALLAGQAARHRLLLLLSDGKPNDVDVYAGRYGIEDTRQAVAEARLQGIVPFCLTVDRDAPSYMPSLFGPRGYTMLRRQELLPAVVAEVVRRLVAR